jgi:hypothetical protein
MKKQIGVYFLILSFFCLLTGCATSPSKKANQAAARTLPHVYAIGTESILTFQKGEPLEIPVEGKDLASPDVRLAADVTGTTPIGDDEAEFDRNGKPHRIDLVPLILKSSYVDRLHDGDQITVHMFVARQIMATNIVIVTNITSVTISNAAQSVITNTVTSYATNELTIVSNVATAFATRTFTAYSSDYYREHVAQKMVPIYDIQAFPLPLKEAQFLFGPLVAKYYFVVRLSVRNTQNEDKLINSGMIVASGRAIVEPQNEPLFTLPVKVVPQSALHLYTILDDREPAQPRAIFFRELEFAGALASASAVAFGGTPDLIKGIGLASGVFVPEMKKLLVDPWPGYKRNLVNFAMPELLKVPQNSVSGHKYLFFSKAEIQTLISDPTLFDVVKYGSPAVDIENVRQGLETRVFPPKVNLISLAFDSLEIPFEKVVPAGEPDIFARVSKMSGDISQQEKQLEEIQAGLSNTNFYFSTSLSRTNVVALLASASQLATNLVNQTNAAYQIAVSNLVAIAKAFTNQDYDVELVKNSTYGLEALKAHQLALGKISRDLLGGADAHSYETTLTNIESAIATSKAGIQFYQQCADLLGNGDFQRLVVSLQSNPADSGKFISEIKSVLEFRDKYTFIPGLQVGPVQK